MPPIPPVTPPSGLVPTSRARSADAVAAQRAFFASALGKAAPAAAQNPVVAVAAPAPMAPPPRPAPQVERVDIPDEPPTRILRPGSMVDITV